MRSKLRVSEQYSLVLLLSLRAGTVLILTSHAWLKTELFVFLLQVLHLIENKCLSYEMIDMQWFNLHEKANIN